MAGKSNGKKRIERKSDKVKEKEGRIRKKREGRVKLHRCP